jgi:hypothetical protein
MPVGGAQYSRQGTRAVEAAEPLRKAAANLMFGGDDLDRAPPHSTCSDDEIIATGLFFSSVAPASAASAGAGSLVALQGIEPWFDG